MSFFSPEDALAFGQCRVADDPEYWDDPDSRADQHRHHIRNLLIAGAFLVVAGIVVHPSLLALVLMLLPLLTMEWLMLRRTSNKLGVELGVVPGTTRN